MEANQVLGSLQPKYFLSKAVALCVREDCVVLLDVDSGKYMAVEMPQARTLTSRVEGWPACYSSTDDRQDVDEKEVSDVLREMLNEGVLTADRCLGKGAAPTTSRPPCSSAYDYVDRQIVSVRLHHVVGFFFLFLKCSLMMRRTHFSKIVACARRTRCALAERRGLSEQPVSYEVDKARELVAIFERLLPWSFTAHNRCFLHSFVLLRFLARYGVDARWVFGVQTAPFLAHCWLQIGETVLNDSFEHASGFTPIFIP